MRAGARACGRACVRSFVRFQFVINHHDVSAVQLSSFVDVHVSTFYNSVSLFALLAFRLKVIELVLYTMMYWQWLGFFWSLL